MPSGSISSPDTPDSCSSKKSFDGFHRRKIGSLRDNSKLFKILQQFENGDKGDEHLAQLSKTLKSFAVRGSAPCSFSKRTSMKNVFDPGASTKSNGVVKTLLCPTRRHSEGEVQQHKSGNNFPIEPIFESSRLMANPKDLCETTAPAGGVTHSKSANSVISGRSGVNNESAPYNTANRSHRKEFQNSSPGDSYNRLRFMNGRQNGIINHANYVQSPNNASIREECTEKRSAQSEDDPPPIPRRGLSLPVEDIMQNTRLQTSKKKNSPSSPLAKSPTSPKNVIKQDSVKRAIQMYEGLSSKLVKNHKSRRSGNYPNFALKKELSNNDSRKAVTLSRKSSKRNSFRAAKNPSSQEIRKQGNPAQKPTNQDSKSFKHSKDDSGVSFSDTEELKSPQGIYQTLCSMTLPVEQCDTYDRLNRIHDMVNRIHKGQSSTCAACRAVPTGSVQLSRTSGLALVHVKCNEMSPHHHPPCICFSCRNSVFSCSQKGVPSALDDFSLSDQEENLYYNVCCLNGPNCEGWRRSRRRPVCEQNGRLCVVNCDMEKQQPDNCQFYEKIFEWNTKRPTNHRREKQLSGDSCDSDEGWVDITDSEDDKTVRECSLMVTETKNCQFSEASARPEVFRKNSESVSIQNISYDVEHPSHSYPKLSCDISRATSSEHLYETIADIEAQNSSSADDLREKTTDNEPDSGEWSTESSSSPTPGEPDTLLLKKKISTTSTASKFTVASDLDYQDCGSKKTFIKSVLGRKSASQKKKKMSHFFVPWLVANEEYGASPSPKSTVKKQGTKALKVDNASKSNRAFSKSQRSQSIPSCAASSCLSTRKIFSSSEILDRCKSDMKELEQINGTSDSNFGLSAESIAALSERGSLASSTYLRADQLHCTPVDGREKPSVPEDSSITDVSVEKIFRRSTSGESMHSYIVFRPIKEEEVPLYQFYERNMKERVTLCRSPESLSPVMWSSALDGGGMSSGHECQKSSALKPQLSVVEQLSPDTKDMKMLWCELPEVKESGILERISAQELKLQEAAFEFIQSQASYIRSLKVLYEYFIRIPEFSSVHSSICVLSKHEHDVLFSDIIIVKEVSERLMAELTSRWSDSILIPDICDIIYRHASMPSFSIYVKYCSNRVYQEKTLKELEETRLCFLEVLRKHESNPACQGLSLESFLFLPMQHIARLPLLLDNIFRWLSPDSPSFNTCKLALESVHKTFMECNEGARKMERLEEMFILNKQLEFKECKVIALISASRWLLKRGELVKLEFDKKTFGRTSRCLRIPLYIFLFNDLLVITKRKSEDSYTVIDYCQRDKIKATAVDAKDLQQPDLVPRICRYLIYLTLFSNHQGIAIDLILNCTLQSERTRWIEAIHPPPQTKSAEVWEYDSPQVQCVRNYIAQQPDELSMQESDVVTIHRKMNDGWYEGRRLRDGMQGWFPASYTMDIPCSRARASNLRQCYRLLMLSQKHEAKG